MRIHCWAKLIIEWELLAARTAWPASPPQFSLCTCTVGNQHETSIKFAVEGSGNKAITLYTSSYNKYTHTPKWVHDPNTIEEWLLSDACKSLMNGAMNNRMSERKTKKAAFDGGWFSCSGIQNLCRALLLFSHKRRAKSLSRVCNMISNNTRAACFGK